MDLETLGQLLTAPLQARAVQVACALGLFEAIDGGAGTAAAIAAHVQASERGVAAIVGVLCAMGLVEQREGRYRLMPVATRHLLAGSPESLALDFVAQSRSFERAAHLIETARAGAPPALDTFASEAAEVVDRRNRATHHILLAHGDGERLASQVDLARAERLLDVGGGPGTLAVALCRANPRLVATVLDLPHTVASTRALLPEIDDTGRVQAVPGDFRREIPAGFEVALVSNIVHFLGEADVDALFERIARALPLGGRIIVKDTFAPEQDQAPSTRAAALGLDMLMYFDQGRTYRTSEISAALARAGARIDAVLDDVVTATVSER